MTSLEDDVDAAAAKLYRLPPTQFTGARNERASRESGELAQRIKAFRKPSVAAWAMNLLVHDGQLAEAIELSQALHEAQEDLDAATLSQLGRQRRALAAGLARRAGELAESEGTALSASVIEEVERTVNAAIIDADVASAVLTGRLIRTIQADDVTALADVVAGSLPGPAEPAAPRDDLAEKRARKAAEAALREADQAATEAERQLAQVTARLDKGRERADHLRDRIDELSAELERLATDADRADAEVDRLEAEQREAEKRAQAAATEAERARAALES